MVASESGIIRDAQVGIRESHFTFDLVPLSYESVDVVVGENWLLRHKAEMPPNVFLGQLVGFTPVVRKDFVWNLYKERRRFATGSCRLTSLERQEEEMWCLELCIDLSLSKNEIENSLTNAPAVFIEFNEPGEYESHVKMIRGVTEGKEKRGADDFVVYYDARSKDLKACLEKGVVMAYKGQTSIWRDVRRWHIEEAYTNNSILSSGADTMLCGFRLNNHMASMEEGYSSCLKVMSFSLRWGLSFEYGCASFEAWYGKEMQVDKTLCFVKEPLTVGLDDTGGHE
ncbi:hypothetical protein Tco_0651607 [Tanacetum coccineum]|uniref:Uncharacterized protein n=1 Tax=Tanacetum coccineum TaxID=301880 RepID=A0ABQ4WVJ2_9ASTR